MTDIDKQPAALSQMLGTADVLNSWRLRVQRLEVPEKGSQLANDDKIFPHMEISQLARLSLASAGEHLRLALDAIKAGEIYPSSHFTVLRGALVGASQAVWILGSDEQEVRQERGLIVLAEMYAQMGKYYGSFGGISLTEEDRESLVEQQIWLEERRDGVAAVRRTRTSLSITEVIGAAADLTFANQPHRDLIRLLWREMSADSHVLAWSLFQRTNFDQRDRRSGIGLGVAPGNLEKVAEPFMASFRMLREGWSLFDRRCEAN